MGRIMQNASFSLAEVAYKAGDITYQVRESVSQAQLRVHTRTENVSGVMLPVFEHTVDGADAFELTGLGRGGQQVQKCKEIYTAAVVSLIELASLQVAMLAVV
jgi:V-type H+-transporting ATPase subunit D